MPSDHPLRIYRVGQRLSQEELAIKLGVSSVTLSRWETGARNIDKSRLTSISEATGIPKADLRPDLAALFSEAAQ